MVSTIFLVLTISCVCAKSISPTSSQSISTSTPATVKSTSTSTPTTSPPWINPSLGGKLGNPGSGIYLSNKSMDALHSFAIQGVARSIQAIQFGDLSIPSGPGVLTIKSPRVTEVKLTDFQYQLQEPNEVWSRLFGGRLVADGQWQFRMDDDEEPATGKYKAMISDAELVTSSKLGRTSEAKPMIQTLDCKANYSQMRVEIEGATNLTFVDSCDTPICQKARKFYEDAICQALRKFVQDSINAPLSTFPARFNLSDDQKLDYALLNNEPKVTKTGLWAGMEGKIQWRGMAGLPFSPPALTLVDKKRMLTFGMADFTFNSLFHQAHSQNYRFSANDLLKPSSSLQTQLSLNCSSVKPRRVSPVSLHQSDAACLGSLMENLTESDQQLFFANETGDLVFKTEQKAMSVFILSDRTAYFDGGNGNLEIYGPATSQQNGQRKLLARAAVHLLRGSFEPKWNGINITGAIKLVRLTLDKGIGQPTTMTSDWLSKFSYFAMPILTDMFNAFLNKIAQFPIPMLDGFKCTSPEFMVSSRTMQVDCDVQQK